MKRISVYIPAYNCAEYLSRCIAGLLQQSLRPDEILVIDDGSRDSTREIANSYNEVTLISHPENCGLGAARNTAFQSARNELVASLDADCVPEPEWLASLAARIDDAWPGWVGGCSKGCGIRSLTGGDAPICRNNGETRRSKIPPSCSAVTTYFASRQCLEPVATTGQCAPTVKMPTYRGGLKQPAGTCSTNRGL